MIDSHTFFTIILMAVATYSTRVISYLVLRNRALSPRVTAVLEATPGCVLISVIAPQFVTTNPANLIALLLTVLAATRWSMLPTVLIGIVSAGVLRHWLGA